MKAPLPVTSDRLGKFTGMTEMSGRSLDSIRKLVWPARSPLHPALYPGLGRLLARLTSSWSGNFHDNHLKPWQSSLETLAKENKQIVGIANGEIPTKESCCKV